MYYDENGRPQYSNCKGWPDNKAEYHKCEAIFAEKACSVPNQLISQHYPVKGKTLAFVKLRAIAKAGKWTKCVDSRISLSCLGGSCKIVPSDGDYGFYPGRTNRVRIGAQVWSWAGDLPAWIGREMWPKVINGTVVAGELVHWPYDEVVPFNQKLSIPSGLKDRVYRKSLENP